MSLILGKRMREEWGLNCNKYLKEGLKCSILK
jgi:hypothetical protein